MLRLGKLATPPTAVTLVVPASVPPAGLVPIATVTVPAKPGTGFPSASRALTCTAGVIAAPAPVVVGATVNASWLAAPTAISNGVLAAAVSPVAAATSV